MVRILSTRVMPRAAVPCLAVNPPPFKRNHWTCNFLVVTMGSCRTDYEAGELFISKTGELVIICPGFGSKIYSKSRPRYEG